MLAAGGHLAGVENLLLRRADVLALVGQPCSFEVPDAASQGGWGAARQ